MESNKVYFIVDEFGYIKGYTSTRFTDEEGRLIEEYFEAENVDEIIIRDYMHYKVKDNKIVKMSDEESKALYPNYGMEPQTPEEIQNDFNIDMDYRMSCLELGRGE